MYQSRLDGRTIKRPLHYVVVTSQNVFIVLRLNAVACIFINSYVQQPSYELVKFGFLFSANAAMPTYTIQKCSIAHTPEKIPPLTFLLICGRKSHMEQPPLRL